MCKSDKWRKRGVFMTISPHEVKSIHIQKLRGSFNICGWKETLDVASKGSNPSVFNSNMLIGNPSIIFKVHMMLLICSFLYFNIWCDNPATCSDVGSIDYNFLFEPCGFFDIKYDAFFILIIHPWFQIVYTFE